MNVTAATTATTATTATAAATAIIIESPQNLKL